MKKSRICSSKSTVLRDLQNSFSFFTLFGFVVFAIVYVYMVLGPYFETGNHLAFVLEEYLSKPHTMAFSSSDGAEIMLTVPGAAAMGILQLRFLHSKSNCYTMLSLGITRKNLYKNRIIIPIIAMSAVVIITKLIALRINISCNGMSAVLFSSFIVHLLISLQSMLVSYFVALLCATFCGRTIEAAASAFSIIILPSMLSETIKTLFAETLFGANYDSANIVTHTMDVALPISPSSYIETALIYYYPYTSGQDGGFSQFTVAGIFAFIWCIAAVLGMMLLARYFDRKFKPENVGFKGICKTLSSIISYTAALFIFYVVFDLCNGYNYPETRSGTILAILVGLASAVVVSFLASFIIHFSFTKLKSALIGAGAILGTIVIISLLSITGIFGQFNKLPDIKDIESVCITAPFSVYDKIDASMIDTDDTPLSIEGGIFRFTVFDTEQIAFDEEEGIKKVMEFHKATIDYRNNDNVSAYEISYTLKDGTEYIRSYTNISDEALKKALEIYDTNEFEEKIRAGILPEKYYYTYDDLNETPDELDDDQKGTSAELNFKDSFMIIQSKEGAITTDITITEKEFLKLREALADDVVAMTYEEWYTPTSKELGGIGLSLSLKQPVRNTLPGETRPYYDYTENFQVYYPIYEDMEKTVQVLKELELLGYLSEKANIAEAYICDLDEVIRWRTRDMHYGESVDIHGPVFCDEEYLLFTESEEDFKEAGAVKVTDKKEIKRYIDSGYTYYYTGTESYKVLFLFDGTEEKLDEFIYKAPIKALLIPD